MRLPCLLLLFASIVAPSHSLAQRNLSDWSAVLALPVGADVSMKTKSGDKLQGRVRAVAAEGIVLLSSERAFPGRRWVERRFDRDQIQEIRLNRRNWSTLAGAAIGLGLGVTVGAIADARAQSNEDNGVIGATLGILGTVIGAGIGRTVPFVRGPKVYVAP